MDVFWQRLRAYPSLAIELTACSFFINFLALASSLYSIQVLNRYLSLGIDATLITLTFGALIAIGFEFSLRHVRLKQNDWLCNRADDELANKALDALTKSEFSALEAIAVNTRREALSSLNVIQQCFGAQNLAGLMDAPFAALFLLVLYFLSPWLCFVALLLILSVVVVSLISHKLSANHTELQQEQSLQAASYNASFASGTELMKAFQADRPLREGWDKNRQESSSMRRVLMGIQSVAQNLTYSSTMLMSVLMMGLGAREVFVGGLDVGMLIGANILASRALANVNRVLQMSESLNRGKRALGLLAQLDGLPRERSDGVTLPALKGELQLDDLSFAYEGQPTPLFERFSMPVNAGGVVVVTGPNGAGKTTLARLLVGLLEPGRGRILIDGMDIRQAQPEWWRRQVVYLPQEPTFFDGTLRENLSVLRPEAPEETLLQLCRELALGNYVEGSPEGLSRVINNAGALIPVGIRTRLALVRALVGDGQLVVLDDPTEGVDEEGCAAIATVLNQQVKAGKTIIVMSNEPFIIKAAQMAIDLGVKPVPRIVMAQSTEDSVVSQVEKMDA